VKHNTTRANMRYREAVTEARADAREAYTYFVMDRKPATAPTRPMLAYHAVLMPAALLARAVRFE
jgi:hypothetical protein